MKAFLDYVAGKVTNDSFVQELEEAVEKAKQNREWRHEYMTLLMRDQINVEKGIEQGIKGTVSILKNLGIPQETILVKIQEQYHLSLEEAKRYLYIGFASPIFLWDWQLYIPKASIDSKTSGKTRTRGELCHFQSGSALY